MATKQQINICLITDSNYVDLTLSCMNSIRQSKSYQTQIMFHVIGDGLTDVQKNKFGRFDEPYFNGCMLSYYDKSKELDDFYSKLKQNSHVSRSACLKFCIPTILDKIDRTIYIDGDTFVKRDLSDLYNFDLKGKQIAAVKDFGLLRVWRNENNPCIKNDTYFQSGLMVFDLKKMRKNRTADRLLAAKLDKFANDPFMDQNVFNYVLHDDVTYLPPEYCCSVHKMIQGMKQYKDVQLLNSLYGTSYSNILEFIMNAYIFHFHGKKEEMKKNRTLKSFFDEQSKLTHDFVNC